MNLWVQNSNGGFGYSTKIEKLPAQDIWKFSDILIHPWTRNQNCQLWPSLCTSVLASEHFHFGSHSWSSSVEWQPAHDWI